MPLTILSIAYPLAPVSPHTAGGAEQVLSTLDRAITAAGHCSLVVAQAGSGVTGTLYATPAPRGVIDDGARAWTAAAHQANIDRALREHRVDLIHFHGIDFASYRVPRSVPALATLHLPPAWYPSHIWDGSPTQLQCVSHTQRLACPTRATLPVVPNGVSLYALPRRPRPFALALGRICPEKNLHAALEAGTLARTPVLLGGEVYPYAAHQTYFQEELEPRLLPPHRFLGPVTLPRKRRLLAAARCLLLPTLAPETSSLVAMEALAAGTPVIAYPSGAIPEIVEDGRTGFLVTSAAEMARAIAHVSSIDSHACQERAQTLFSADRMTRQYLALYARLATGAWHAAG